MTATLLVRSGELDAEEVRVSGDAFRHLFRARRLAVGDPVRLVDGNGGARFSRVLRASRSEAILRPGKRAPSNEPELRLELLVAALRPQRASWLVEKATEIGASAVRFLGCERAQRRFGDATLERLRRVAGAAVEQSGRSRLPEVTGIHEWREIPGLVARVELACVLDPAGAEALGETVSAVSGSGPVAVIVGPEGGFTREEYRQLVGEGCRAAALGRRVLRVETAALVGAAAFLLAADTGRPS